MKCYISGPITGVEGYRKKFDQAEFRMKHKGYSVVNPARVNGELPKDTEYEDYMKMSMAMLQLCDCIYMMKGWKQSRGAQFEHTYAKIMGIEVMYEEDENNADNQ